MKNKAFILTVLAAAAVLAGCATKHGIKQESAARVETIEHKGTAFGDNSLPEWLSTYLIKNGTRSVENLPDFENMYVFIGQNYGSDLQQALAWANNYYPDVGAEIEPHIVEVFKKKETLVPNNPDALRMYNNNVINTLVQARYNGLVKKDQFWIRQRITVKGKQPEERYTAYVLYVIEIKKLNEQICNQIKALKGKYTEIAAALDEVYLQFIFEGVTWE